jgi:hypothetical protein
MLQETPYEFIGSQSACPGFSAFGILVSESDLSIIQLEDTSIGERHTEDVGRKIFERPQSIAHRLAVNDPILRPDLLGDLVEPFCIPQCIPELGPKEDGQGFHREKERFPAGNPGLSIVR